MIRTFFRWGFKIALWGGIFLYAFPDVTVLVISEVASGFTKIFCGFLSIAWDAASSSLKESIETSLDDAVSYLKDRILGR